MPSFVSVVVRDNTAHGVMPGSSKAWEGCNSRNTCPNGASEESIGIYCRAPLLEECLQHHGHKGDPGVMPGTCGAIGERAQGILVWVRAPGRWERLPPMETRSHEG